VQFLSAGTALAGASRCGGARAGSGRGAGRWSRTRAASAFVRPVLVCEIATALRAPKHGVLGMRAAGSRRAAVPGGLERQ
jgi:hypothetical protein